MKKFSRKKSQPLWLHKLDPALLSTDDLRTLNIGSKEELLETGYILINEDGLKLPQPIDGDIGIAELFIRNPVQVSSLDDLFDLLEINQGNPTKYCLAMKESAFDIQQQIFRKAFYENSQTFQDSMIFAEINNSRIGQKVGLK